MRRALLRGWRRKCPNCGSGPVLRILFTIFAVGCVALSLYLLPRFKGMIVAFQWARYMGGFRDEPRRDVAQRDAA